MRDEEIAPVQVHLPVARHCRLMNGRNGQRQGGSSLSEQLFVCAVVAFYCVMLAVSFNRSLAAGFGMIGLTLAIGLLIFAYAWRRDLAAAGFIELEHYYRPAGLPRERQPWLATVWRAAK